MPDDNLDLAASAQSALPSDEVTELDDGSVLVELDSEDEVSSTPSHDANLAETLDTFTLNKLASELLELIEKDKKAREERDRQQEEGIRRTGLGDDAPGGATFDGASKVVHPVLAEGCVDFSARAIKELFPANGPVKTKIHGVTDEAKLDKAKRKRDFLNFYMTTRMSEYRSEKETMLTQLPLGGSQYEKYWPDFDKGRICMEFVPIDKVLLPYSANSFYDSPRVTHMLDRTELQIEQNVDSGFYIDAFGIADQQLEETASQQATNKVEGKEASGYNEDGIRTIYEVACWRDVEGEGPAPYVVHIDEPTQKVVAVYRNWKESDEKKNALEWMVEDKFIPWRGAYGIGLPHLIGGLAASLTGALRALLDSAHINNAPTAIKLKGGRASGQNVSVDLTAVTEIEAPAGVDDIRKIMMPMPFNPPSAVLFQLLDWITAQAKGVVATAEEKIADASNQMPVGTTLALIEQGSQVFSAIHSRLHESQRRAIKIICRILADYPELAAADMAKFDVVPQDFLDSDDIEPVSDPHIFSEAQRFAQLQAVMQLAAADAADPSIPWNKLALRRRALTLLRVDGEDELLPKPPEPMTDEPAAENFAALTGRPIKAHPMQDHFAHLKTHLLCILNPMIAQSPTTPGPLLGALLSHVQEHLVLWNAATLHKLRPIVEQKAMLEGRQLSPDELSLECAMAAQEALSQMAQDMLPMINEAAQVVQSKMPQPQQDPAIKATFDAAMAEIQRKTAVDQANAQLKREQMETDHAHEMHKLEMEPILEQIKRENEARFELMRMQAEDERKQFAEHMANMRNEQDNYYHQMTELIKNRDDNETQLQMKLMELERGMQDNFKQMADTIVQTMRGVSNGA